MSEESNIENNKIYVELWRREGSQRALDKLICRYEAEVLSFILYLSGCDWNTAYEITADCYAQTLAEQRLFDCCRFHMKKFTEIKKRKRMLIKYYLQAFIRVFLTKSLIRQRRYRFI